MVKFGPERMYIDCWVKKQTYETFKEILGSGMQYHLQVSCSLTLAPGLAYLIEFSLNYKILSRT